MEKLRASGTPWRRSVAIGLVIAGVLLAVPEGRAAPPGELFLALKAGCAAAAEAQATLPARKTAEEPPAAAMHAFYTCPAGPVPVLHVGRGLLAIGPRLRG
ncbi:hypothetical protein [Paracraurococcus lichenis]|uniref:Uncharacterized protein n=1 Tax=Paracraurococcus lichenis TaxID=3064888 RepID=A0ABT9DYH1_9PROT|nr:hypothetical protein [Paracraurococcus sp. LOR1-02]MDO9708952.1 hypothetical protein [Paracraurococcus sp. LOR1-02]